MRLRPALLSAAAMLALGAGPGCDNMQHQENVHAFEASAHFADGASARTPPAHSVAVEDPLPDDPLTHGSQGGRWASSVPVPVNRELVERGRERFDIFCADCHGEDGFGEGIVVRRGFPKPRALHDPRVVAQADGELFEVITRGRGKMYGFYDRIEPRDRWAIVEFIRALQKSQAAPVSELSAEERLRLDQP